MYIETEGVSGLVTVKAAAKLLQVSPQAVTGRIRRYDLPCLKIGASLLISLDDLRRTYAEPPRAIAGEKGESPPADI